MPSLPASSEQCRIYAKGLDAEGWSQTAIAKELGVSQQDISNWLQIPIANDLPDADAAKRLLSRKTCYHIANCRLEDFQPPDGMTFPLIIIRRVPPYEPGNRGYTSL